MNPRQNALLDLKLAGIRHLEFEDFFAMFGEGRLAERGRSTKTSCVPALPPVAAALLGPLDRVLRREQPPPVLFPRH